MCVNIPFETSYERYYHISEKDYSLYQTDRNAFLKKYEIPLERDWKKCFTENFIGAGHLRDYDGSPEFWNCLCPCPGEPGISGYLWMAEALFIGLIFQDERGQRREIFVPPVQAIPKEESGYYFPLRRNCRIFVFDEKASCFAYKC